MLASTAGVQEAKKSEIAPYLLWWFVGFGTGHFYLGDDAAIKFLTLNAVTFAAALTGLVLTDVWALDPEAA